MSEILDTVLLLALPASGKSEVRRYLNSLTEEECRRDFHMGPTVQLDDFPYVHLMRRIDDELAALGQARLFFHAPDRPFQDTLDWGTLIHLLNQDHDDLVRVNRVEPPQAALWLFDRLDEASKASGGKARLAGLEDAIRSGVAAKLEAEVQQLVKDKNQGIPDVQTGKTLVIEFARGGPDKSPMPLTGHYGYQYSLSQLAPAILEKATILYIWVTPEESRRKNDARTDPNDPGSILHHGVPIEVMLNDYGCDDMDWLEQQGQKPGTVTVKAHGKAYHLPVARVDNRVDKTSFIRKERADWLPEEVAAIRDEIKRAVDTLFQA